ncbi:7073_t:CDS:2, partial [Ambispora leptoticha]
HANLEQKFIPKARSFVGLDETSPNGSQTSLSPSFHEANIRLMPQGPGLRIEGEKDGGPLAVRNLFTRKG